MKVEELANTLKFDVYTTTNSINIKGVYCCDLLSNALVKLNDGDAWITVMNNVNVAAVAYSKNASCIILAEGIKPDKELLEKALEYNISILGSIYPTYETSKLISKNLIN